jgi:hypothetical protein
MSFATWAVIARARERVQPGIGVQYETADGGEFTGATNQCCQRDRDWSGRKRTELRRVAPPRSYR